MAERRRVCAKAWTIGKQGYATGCWRICALVAPWCELAFLPRSRASTVGCVPKRKPTTRICKVFSTSLARAANRFPLVEVFADLSR